jgi:hypothetical protein
MGYTTPWWRGIEGAVSEALGRDDIPGIESELARLREFGVSA